LKSFPADWLKLKTEYQDIRGGNKEDVLEHSYKDFYKAYKTSGTSLEDL
jgi:hypothetical protein